MFCSCVSNAADFDIKFASPFFAPWHPMPTRKIYNFWRKHNPLGWFAALRLILGNYLYPALFRRNLGTLLTLILKFFHQAIVAQFADGGRGRSGLIAEGRPVPAVVAKMPDVAGGDAAVFHQRCVDKKNRSRSSGLVKVGFGGKPIRGADPLISRGISRLPPHPIDRVFRN